MWLTESNVCVLIFLDWYFKASILSEILSRVPVIFLSVGIQLNGHFWTLAGSGNH